MKLKKFKESFYKKMSALSSRAPLVAREIELLEQDVAATQRRIELLKQLREMHAAGEIVSERLNATSRRVLQEHFPPDKIFEMLRAEYSTPLPEIDSTLKTMDPEGQARTFKRFSYP